MIRTPQLSTARDIRDTFVIDDMDHLTLADLR